MLLVPQTAAATQKGCCGVVCRAPGSLSFPLILLVTLCSLVAVLFLGLVYCRGVCHTPCKEARQFRLYFLFPFVPLLVLFSCFLSRRS